MSLSKSEKQKKVFLSLLLYSFFLLLFISMDSYLQDMIRKCDSTYFYMCGKAWMNGMIPYQDFSDSKGPLLWLLYGIGYLLSPRSMVGVFWVSSIWYGVVFFIVYKSSRIFLDTRLSVMVAVLMSISFFLSAVHKEVRAEDFCQLFIVWSIYEGISLICENINVKKAFFCLGICFAGTLLIKFTIAAMIGSVALYVFVYSIKRKESLWQMCLYFLLGFIVLTLPFVVYFLSVGALQTFIDEYFLKTFLTTYNVPGLTYGDKLINAMVSPNKLLMVVPAVVGLVFFFLQEKKAGTFFLFVFICFFIIANMGNNMAPTYYQVLSVFWMPGLLYLLNKYGHSKYVIYAKRNLPLFACLIGLLVVGMSYSTHFRREQSFLVDSECRQNFHRVTFVMKQVDNPRILYYGTPNTGYDVPVGGLPACRYWAAQIGATDDMKNNQQIALETQAADFVLINRNDKETAAILRKLGYTDYSRLNPSDYQAMFSKRKLTSPTANYHYSSLDVLERK